MGFSARKIAAGATYTPSRPISFSVLPNFFDKLLGPQQRFSFIVFYQLYAGTPLCRAKMRIIFKSGVDKPDLLMYNIIKLEIANTIQARCSAA